MPEFDLGHFRWIAANPLGLMAPALQWGSVRCCYEQSWERSAMCGELVMPPTAEAYVAAIRTGVA